MRPVLAALFLALIAVPAAAQTPPATIGQPPLQILTDQACVVYGLN